MRSLVTPSSRAMSSWLKPLRSRAKIRRRKIMPAAPIRRRRAKRHLPNHPELSFRDSLHRSNKRKHDATACLLNIGRPIVRYAVPRQKSFFRVLLAAGRLGSRAHDPANEPAVPAYPLFSNLRILTSGPTANVTVLQDDIPTGRKQDEADIGAEARLCMAASPWISSAVAQTTGAAPNCCGLPPGS